MPPRSMKIVTVAPEKRIDRLVFHPAAPYDHEMHIGKFGCRQGLLKTGMRAEMARLAVARKLSATVLAVWNSGESFDAGRILRKAV